MRNPVVEYVCREDRLTLELRLEVVTIDGLATSLAGVQVQADLAGIQLPSAGQATGDLVLEVDAPALGDVGVGVEVEDRVGTDLDATAVFQKPDELRTNVRNVVDKRLDLDLSPGYSRRESGHEFPALFDQCHDDLIPFRCSGKQISSFMPKQHTLATAQNILNK